MFSVAELSQRTRDRSFTVADARRLIERSYYLAGTHADVHIQLGVLRPPDYHFQDLPQYEERHLHSMFRSLEDASTAVAAGLNCDAGAAAGRFLGVTGVNRVALYSRSAAGATPNMMVRSAIASMGARTGTMYGDHQTLLVVMVLSIYGGQYVVLTTAYPTHGLSGRPIPPEGTDFLEYGNQRFAYPAV